MWAPCLLSSAYWVLHSGTGFFGPGAGPRPRQRSQAPLWDAEPAGGTTTAAGAGGVVWVDPPPGCAGGLAPLVVSETSVFAFAPAFTRTEAEAGCELELDGVAAAPQAAVSNADATRTTFNLLIAQDITQRAPSTNGLVAA